VSVPAGTASAAGSRPAWRGWLGFAALAAATAVAYGPALDAGWIWDDDSYVLENPAVQRPDGILHAWVPGATPQWYPMVFVSFWAQHALHGLEPFGYHLVNVLLHLASGLLAWRLLAALRVPGALLAAGIFLLHPVQAESVAWVTERKNVLSLAFALASLLAWTRFLQDGRPFPRRAGTWAASLALFVLAMLSKTTAVAVPVAAAAIAWWRPWEPPGARRGERVAALLAPFFAIGIAMGLFTAYLEATHVGASGAEFARTPVERLLHASKAWWWYLGTWAWPSDLLFVYPPFRGGAAAGWAAFAAGLAAAGGAAVAARRGVRGAAVAFLCFSAGVFPALGFVNLYPLRYAPAADHFMHMATVPLAAATAWIGAALVRRLPASRAPAAAGALAAALLLALASATNAHARAFRDEETLWRATLARNPDAWLASNNLVSILLRRAEEAGAAGDAAAHDALLAECSALAESAVRLAGSVDMPVQSNMSEVRRLQGRLPEALAALDEAVRIQPAAPGPRWQRGRVLELLGRFEEAGPEYARAVEMSPRQLVYLREWVRWLAKAGRNDEAYAVARRIAEADPADAEALANLGSLALDRGDVAEARASLVRALGMAQGDLAVVIAPRAVRALLSPPADPRAANEAVAIASGLARLTEGGEPISLVLLARAQAAAGDPRAAQATLARADALLAAAPAEVREAISADRAAAQEALGAPAVPGAPPPPSP
jgi:tetratricopeptide (TPR) repeat protein